MLTKKDIDKLAFSAQGPSKQILWDKDGSGKVHSKTLSGFGVRVYPSGKKSFVLSYRVKGKGAQRTMVLGQYGAITDDEARRRARKHLGSISDNDLADPLVEKKQNRAGKKFAELCDAYMEQHAKVHKKSWIEDQRRINKYLKPEFGTKRINSISREDIMKFHCRLGEGDAIPKPYQANRCLEQLSKMFELAILWGFLDEGHMNPAKKIQAFKEKKRDRWVTIDELPRLWKAIEDEENLYGRFAFKLYLFTGMRRDELLNAKWEDIDSSRRELRLAETKSGRIHYVPLNDDVWDLLSKIPRKAENPYILPGNKEGQHLVNVEKIWRRVRKAADLEDVRLHDLRRTVGSWLAQSGSSLHLIGKVLNHSNPSTTAVYARFAQENVKQALDEHGKNIKRIVEPETEQ